MTKSWTYRFAAWLAARHGFTLVPAARFQNLSTHVADLTTTLNRSGHLGHRYHVRRALNAIIGFLARSLGECGSASW